MRVKKVEPGNITTHYVSNLYEVQDGVAVKYIFGNNMRIAQVKGSTKSFFHKNHLMSSTVMSNASGAEAETTEYMPFGKTRAHTGTDLSDYKFTDQELDKSTGFYNYDARLYDPLIGRFVIADSIVPDWFDPQSLNKYSYCYNNPLILVDPDGREPGDVFAFRGNTIYWRAALIGSLTDKGPYGHVAIEITPDKNGNERILSSDSRGVYIEIKKDALKNRTYDTYRPDKKIDLKKLEIFANRVAIQEFGGPKKYSYDDLIDLAEKNYLGPEIQDSYTCAGIVANALQNSSDIDYGDANDPNSINAGTITPNEVANHPDLKKVKPTGLQPQIDVNSKDVVPHILY